MTVWREDHGLVCGIQEHLYTKFWEHKLSAHVFAEAMERVSVGSHRRDTHSPSHHAMMKMFTFSCAGN